MVLGSHAHVVGGSGWSGETYVSYGLGNFVWYHDRQPDTGVLTLRLDADGVVDPPPGPIRSGELPVLALARLGWRWGGQWVTAQDHQHVAAQDFRRLAGRWGEPMGGELENRNAAGDPSRMRNLGRRPAPGG